MPDVVSGSTGMERGPQLAGRRVIIVLGPLELGGAERQALLFARYLIENQGVDVRVWGTMGQPGRIATLCEQYGIPWRIVANPWVPGGPRRLKALAAFARQLRYAQPDVILPYMWQPSIACNLVWRMTGAGLCVWNQRDHGLTRTPNRYEPWAIRMTPRFIANSEYIANYLINELGAQSSRVHVIHNGIELAAPEDDRHTWRTRLGVGEEHFLACMVANLHEDKDHATLIKAWRLVVDRLDEPNKTKLLLAGRFDTTHEKLMELTSRLNLESQVSFLGPVADIPGLLNAIDLGILSSPSEGSPNAVLECMAAGLAVVASDIPAIREAMPSAAYEYLAPSGNSEALASAILKLMADNALRRRLGALNRQHAESRFSKEQMCERMLQVIVDGLNERLSSKAKKRIA